MDNLFSLQCNRSRADVAIDLGTANTIVVDRGSGVVFNEPSICCFTDSGAAGELVAAGSEAHAMIGRVAGPMRITRPLRNGVLSDMAAARELIRYAARKTAEPWRLRKARALIGIPDDATKAERRALLTAAQDAGLGHVQLLSEPLLAAVGAGLDVDAPRGQMVVDCGAGTTEVAVISLGSICVSNSVRIGGETLDEALLDYLCLKHRFQIGASTAERLKLDLAQALGSAGDGNQTITIKGNNLASSRPESLSLPTDELANVYEKHLQGIADVVRSALQRTPPELLQDIFDDGLLLTGGAAMAGLLKQRVAEATGLAVRLADAPLDCVALGLEHLLEDLEFRFAA